MPFQFPTKTNCLANTNAGKKKKIETTCLSSAEIITSKPFWILFKIKSLTRPSKKQGSFSYQTIQGTHFKQKPQQHQ